MSSFVGGAALPRTLMAVTTAIAVARVAVVWNDLPPVMASHFGPSGVPDAFMPREGFFGVFAIAGGGTTLLLATMPLTLRLIPPSLINLPNRHYWLSPERREETLERLGAWLAWLAVPTSVLLLVVLDATIRANLARAPLDNATVIGALALYAVGMLGTLVGMHRAFRVPAG